MVKRIRRRRAAKPKRRVRRKRKTLFQKLLG